MQFAVPSKSETEIKVLDLLCVGRKIREKELGQDMVFYSESVTFGDFLKVSDKCGNFQTLHWVHRQCLQP